MNSLFDLGLDRPLPLLVIRGLLFGTFTLHLLFALFTLGTAILGMAYVFRSWWGGRPGDQAWGGEILHALMAHKSLAVVLGVAPLLLIQVGFTVPFFTAVNLLAPYWLLVIPFLIVAFLAVDFVIQALDARRRLRLVVGTLGLGLLLAVPGILVAVLIAAENPGAWLEIVQRGYRLPGALGFHWLARYLHFIGASIVAGAMLHYFAAPSGGDARRRSLLCWMTGGLLGQCLLGLLLYLSLPARPKAVASSVLVVGTAATLVLLWRLTRPAPLALSRLLPLALLILLPMLLVRQSLQDREILPLNDALKANAARYQATIQPHASRALAGYQATLDSVYDMGQTIYGKSCAFCHGAQADGRGMEAGNLAIPPEVISAVRAERAYLRDRLLAGVAGSAMPYFTIYTRDQMDGLVGYLDHTYGVLARSEPLAVRMPPGAQEQARQTFATVCSSCHGTGGRGDGPAARGLQPSPPDLTRRTLLSQRMFEVITAGYPGTAMASFAGLTEDVRWGLVKHVSGLYGQRTRQ